MTGLTDERTAELIDILDSYEQMIEDAQSSKKDLYAEIRASDLKGMEKADVAVAVAEIKKAVAIVRARRSNPAKLERADGIAAEAERMADAYERLTRTRSARAREAGAHDEDGSHAGEPHSSSHHSHVRDHVNALDEGRA